MFSYSKKFELRREDSCADALGQDNEKVALSTCHGQGGNQKWEHTKVRKRFDDSRNVSFRMIFGPVSCFRMDR